MAEGKNFNAVLGFQYRALGIDNNPAPQALELRHGPQPFAPTFLKGIPRLGFYGNFRSLTRNRAS